MVWIGRVKMLWVEPKTQLVTNGAVKELPSTTT